MNTSPEKGGSNLQAERALADAGVFKGHHGLRGLAEASEFWERQNYGTRLYYGPGGLDYLHRGVLETAVKVLDSVSALQSELAEAKRALSEGPRWIPVSERLPDDEQKVLGCWVGSSVCNEGAESLIYSAADAPDSHDRWFDVFSEERDPPTHWMLLELPT